MSHHAIGALLYEKGDAAGARAAYDRALAIRQKLADANPSVTQIQHDLADIHYAIGGMLWATRRPRRGTRGVRQARWPSARSWSTQTPVSHIFNNTWP